ncbi:HtrA2 peptidase [Nitzschia inconspicua]|uniref:HtrA2 peptidase n=1 Tax=Nitzschia inconspicua TaxID=303405 RepID=A0A9K3KLA7_9STRA|nr:HtrA2 peptidase [Nitzschia inconspicua]
MTQLYTKNKKKRQDEHEENEKEENDGNSSSSSSTEQDHHLKGDIANKYHSIDNNTPSQQQQQQQQQSSSSTHDDNKRKIRRWWRFFRRPDKTDDSQKSMTASKSNRKITHIPTSQQQQQQQLKQIQPDKSNHKNSNIPDDKKKKKIKRSKKLSTLGSAVRVVTLIVAILLYPLVTDEISYHMAVNKSTTTPNNNNNNLRLQIHPSTEETITTDTTTTESFDPTHHDDDGSERSTTDNVSPNDDVQGDEIPSSDSKTMAEADPKNDAIPEKTTSSPNRPFSLVPRSGTSNSKTSSSSSAVTNNPLSSIATSPSSFSLADKRRAMLSFVTDVVEDVGPSVVRVDTETHLLVQDNRNNDILRDTPPNMGDDDTYVQQGQGSGLIFSSDGLILTNAHVVEDATTVKVTLTDGRVFRCQVMGTDEIVDIAVLKIIPDAGSSMAKLPVAKLGDSDQLSVGKIVIAVGSPGGLDNTVTCGIVSGLERSSMMVGIPHKKVDYIQTDAAINPGNSGGPLIDVETGKVVGINAAIRAHMEGTSFAIPINRVQDIMHDLAAGKEIHHGYLGLGLATCTPEWAKQQNANVQQQQQQQQTNNANNKIPEVYGAIVFKVYPKTPAEQGGLKENDVILDIGGRKVKSADDARKLIDLAPVGENTPITVMRNGNVKVLNVKPVDLSSRLKEIRLEKQRRQQAERQRFQELGPFRSLLQ